MWVKGKKEKRRIPVRTNKETLPEWKRKLDDPSVYIMDLP